MSEPVIITLTFFGCLIGIKQGCLRSPDLFSMFINVAAEELLVEEEEGWIASERQEDRERFSSDWRCHCSDWTMETWLPHSVPHSVPHSY